MSSDLKIEHTHYAFLLTDARLPAETEVKFRLRRIYEECHFFGSLADVENKGVKLELTHIVRQVTRSITQASNQFLGEMSPLSYLPNNVYCFSGAWGFQLTQGITRSITGAVSDEQFIEGLDRHLEELADCANALAQNEDTKESLTLAFDECIKGLLAYKETYKNNALAEKLGGRIKLLNVQKEGWIKVITVFDEIEDVVLEDKDFFPVKPAILNIPNLKYIMGKRRELTSQDLRHFIAIYLHQFLAGYVTAANVPKNRLALFPIFEKQCEELQLSIDGDPEASFRECYLFEAAKGLFMRKRAFDLDKYFEQLLPALKVDFPHSAFNYAEIETLARSVLNQALDEKQKADQEAQFKPQGVTNEYREKKLAELQSANVGKPLSEQSWFFPA